MKKYISTMLVAVMILLTLSKPVSASYEEESVWDGSVAMGFDSGIGEKNDPYIIKNGAQLAYLASTVNSGMSYNNKYFELQSDIILNDEMFTFNSDTGTIKITDGENTSYLGTGIAGDNSGDNTVFDSVASVCGVLYSTDDSVEPGEYGGVLNSWTPIGAEENYFSGIFNGNGFKVSGIYINTSDDYQGLFGYDNSVLKLCGVENSYIHGGNYVGGIAGYGSASDSYNEGYVFGKDEVGGVVGYGSVSDSYNKGYVFGEGNVGGVIGRGSVSDSYNEGYVIGESTVGGVGGYGYNNIHNCYNTGRVTGGERVGGVIGYDSNSNGKKISNCYNTGEVFGEDKVGGIIGLLEYYIKLSNCYNLGEISGYVSVGGIVGYCDSFVLNDSEDPTQVRECYNRGVINGKNYVGGITGVLTGKSGLAYCYNSGAVNGGNYVGGIIGSQSYHAWCTGCYNIGDISGKDYVGGIAGSVSKKSGRGGLSSSYSLCNVSGHEYVGGIVGQSKEKLNDCYYLKNHVIDGNNTIQNGIGSELGSVKNDNSGETTALSETSLKPRMFEKFDYNEVWKNYPDINDGLPMLMSVNGSYFNFKSPDKKVYDVSEFLDLTDMVFEIVQSDGTVKTINDYICNIGVDTRLSIGKHTVTISYEIFSAEFDIVVHNLVYVESKSPTCVDIGWDAHFACSECGYTTREELPVTDNHVGETEIRDAVEPTMDTDGYTGDIYCKDCGKKIAEGEVILKSRITGDVTSDKKINLADVSLLLKYIAKWDVKIDIGIADVTGDSKVNLGDVSLLLKYIAKWEVTLNTTYR